LRGVGDRRLNKLNLELRMTPQGKNYNLQVIKARTQGPGPKGQAQRLDVGCTGFLANFALPDTRATRA